MAFHNEFPELDADDEEQTVTEMESLCVNCEEQGTTRLFLTRIPFFKEVIVSSFRCDHCSYSNADLLPAGVIQEEGIKFTVKVKTKEDMNREVVYTESASLSIPEVQLEVPPQKGALTTVEGVIVRTIEGLEQDQVLRRIQHPEDAAKIDSFVAKLQSLRSGEESFTLIVDDPSGNSFVENPAPSSDPSTVVQHYQRSKEQDTILGLGLQEDTEDSDEEKADEEFIVKDEVLKFHANCPNCNLPCSTRMKIVDVPHFKEAIIMATNCDHCGYRENEVKGGSGIEPKGIRLTLHITSIRDLSRDVIKSDTCKMAIPELEFETGIGTLGGKCSTVEGLLVNIKTQLRKDNPFIFGDSAQTDKLKEFCKKLDEIATGERLNVHFVLEDPAGNSFIQNPFAPEDDPQLIVEKYERTDEENEELGLNDMCTEGYEET